MDAITAQRFLNILDNIFDRLGGIEKQLVDVARLQERVTNQEDAIKRYGLRLDSHSDRLRNTELWQANYGDKSGIERLINHLKSDIATLKEHKATMEHAAEDFKAVRDKVDVFERVLEKQEYQRSAIKELEDKTKQIEKSLDQSKGQKDIVKEGLKWVSGLLAAILAYKLTGG